MVAPWDIPTETWSWSWARRYGLRVASSSPEGPWQRAEKPQPQQGRDGR